jgi:hypothetical protein
MPFNETVADCGPQNNPACLNRSANARCRSPMPSRLPMFILNGISSRLGDGETLRRGDWGTSRRERHEASMTGRRLPAAAKERGQRGVGVRSKKPFMHRDEGLHLQRMCSGHSSKVVAQPIQVGRDFPDVSSLESPAERRSIPDDLQCNQAIPLDCRDGRGAARRERPDVAVQAGEEAPEAVTTLSNPALNHHG